MGVWIETLWVVTLPLLNLVTPFVGVWIETHFRWSNTQASKVTPFVGVWIETIGGSSSLINIKSHPSWVCGLKPVIIDFALTGKGHTLRGCVD